MAPQGVKDRLPSLILDQWFLEPYSYQLRFA